jgi:hypothetical protein
VGFLVKKCRNLDFRASLLAAIDTFAQRKLHIVVILSKAKAVSSSNELKLRSR